MLSCIDGNWKDGEGKDIPLDKPFICLGTTQVVQRFEDGMPCNGEEDVCIRTPNKALPNVDELNTEVPQEQWGLGIDGKPSRPPWSHSYVAYLLDPVDASIHTYINNTGGAERGVQLLNDRVKWMRALRGARVFPAVTLGKRLHSKKYNKFGPNFIVLNFRELGGGAPPENGPKQIGPQDPVKQIGKPVDEPATAEILDDEIPSNGGVDANGRKASAPPTKKGAAKGRKAALGKYGLAEILDDK
jgi:hypothetical protein